MASPSRFGSVSTLYDARQAHHDMQDTWSESSADTAWSSSLPMPSDASASARPDGHPEREDSLPHFDNSPAGQYTGRLHRQTLWPSVDHPRPDTSTATAPVTSASPSARPVLAERVDGFLMTLSLSAADKAVDSGIAAVRRLGRVVSKRIDRKEPASTVLVPEPVIGLPMDVSQWRSVATVPLAQAAADLDAAARRHQVWLASLTPVSPARLPSSSSSGPPIPPRPATATATPSAVPAAVPRPDAEPRRVIESTWGEFSHIANPPGTNKDYDFEHGRIVRDQDSGYDSPAEVTKTTRKPMPTATINKPLPGVPRPESLRRQTVMRRRTVRNVSEVPGTCDGGEALSGPRVTPASPYVPPSVHSEREQAARQSLDGRFQADNGSDNGHPVVDQFIRAGHVSTYVHQVQGGQAIDSWHVQHAVTPTPPTSESSSEDGAAAVWRKMEAESGIRMRD